MKWLYRSSVKLKEGYELIAWAGGIGALLGIGKLFAHLVSCS